LVHRRQNVDPSTSCLTHSTHADVHVRYASANKHNRLLYKTAVSRLTCSSPRLWVPGPRLISTKTKSTTP